MISSGDVQFIFRNVPIVQEIEKLAKQENSYDSLLANEVYKEFIDKLKPFLNDLEPPSNNWDEDKEFLKLIEVVNQQIINQLTKGAQEMSIETVVATKLISTQTIMVLGGVIGLICIGLYAYRCQKNRERTCNYENTDSKDVPTNPQQQHSKPVQRLALTYKPHTLLLIINASKLDKSLGRTISKDAVEKMIANAAFAYYFADDDLEGQGILDAVKCLDEAINYNSEERVFLQLSLLAKPEINAGKSNRFSISEAMQPEQPVEIKRQQKLETMRSVEAFYRI